MTKSDLIERLAVLNPAISKREAELVVNTIFDGISESLATGDRVEIRGFGSFSVKERTARQARNPKTGERVTIDDKKVPFFKTGKELRERVNLKD